jgi:hypothetical protein
MLVGNCWCGVKMASKDDRFATSMMIGPSRAAIGGWRTRGEVGSERHSVHILRRCHCLYTMIHALTQRFVNDYLFSSAHSVSVLPGTSNL